MNWRRFLPGAKSVEITRLATQLALAKQDAARMRRTALQLQDDNAQLREELSRVRGELAHVTRLLDGGEALDLPRRSVTPIYDNDGRLIVYTGDLKIDLEV